jgi:type IV pilus assembly protein PilB
MRELARTAEEKGFKVLSQVGIEQVLSGATSLDEVSRVIDLTERLG